MKVPFLDLTRLHASIARELDQAFRATLESSAFVGAAACRRFEEAFGAVHEAPYAVSCGSGTDALVLALQSLGLAPEDEVILPAMTFVATAEAVVHAGGTPVIADVSPETLLLTPATVERVRTSRTRAVVPVHLYGHIVPREFVDSWLHSGLAVIEDAAQAHLGCHPDGQPIGTATAACFSFFPGKNLGALGDGGIVLTKDAELAGTARRLRDHGRSDKYLHDVVGYCSRLDGLQAALLEVKLRHLPGWTDSRRALADQYREELSLLGHAQIRLIDWAEGAVHHLLVVRVPAVHRDAVRSALAAAGVATGMHYPVALSKQPAMATWATPCPDAEAAADEVLSLPIDPLMTCEEVSYVVQALAQAAEQEIP